LKNEKVCRVQNWITKKFDLRIEKFKLLTSFAKIEKTEDNAIPAKPSIKPFFRPSRSATSLKVSEPKMPPMNRMAIMTDQNA
jgi:hypothetical protein